LTGAARCAAMCPRRCSVNGEDQRHASDEGPSRGSALNVIKRFFSGLFGRRSADAPRAAAFAHFPFEVVETTGEQALAKWEELKTAGRGVPVIVGNAVDDVVESFSPENAAAPGISSLDEMLAAASAIRFPEDFLRMRREEEKTAAISDEELEEFQPDEGEWPAEAPAAPGLTVTYDLLTSQAHPRVYIVLVPTDDPTTIPAHLRWGGFNACRGRNITSRRCATGATATAQNSWAWICHVERSSRPKARHARGGAQAGAAAIRVLPRHRRPGRGHPQRIGRLADGA